MAYTVEGFKPIGNILVLEKQIPKEETKGGIVLVHTAQKLPTQYKVIEVGTGQKNGFTGELVPTIVKKGDVVMINPHAITKMKVWFGEQEDEIWCCFEGDVVGFWRMDEEASTGSKTDTSNATVKPSKRTVKLKGE